MKTALITGATGAIGTALCRAFKGDGFTVIGTDKCDSDAVCSDRFVQVDLNALVDDAPYREWALGEICQTIGDQWLDALVNNAAVQIVASVDKLTVDDWRQSMNVNLLAPFLLIQRLLPYLKAANGAIVNVGSIHSKLTKPGFGCYATTKTALSGLTRGLAVELGGSVRINEITPAATDTPMLRAAFGGRKEMLDMLGAAHPLGRIASPDEIARVAVFLVSEQASFMTGASIPIDGGIGARLHDPE